MSDELTANFMRQLARISASLRDWAVGLPDPAEVMAALAEAQGQRFSPTPRQDPPPSPVYDQSDPSAKSSL